MTTSPHRLPSHSVPRPRSAAAVQPPYQRPSPPSPGVSRGRRRCSEAAVLTVFLLVCVSESTLSGEQWEACRVPPCYWTSPSLLRQLTMLTMRMKEAPRSRSAETEAVQHHSHDAQRRHQRRNGHVFISWVLQTTKTPTSTDSLDHRHHHNCYSVTNHFARRAQQIKLEMWANAQRDGCPSEYRWRPLLNATVWLMPTTIVPCSNAAKMRNPLKLAGCPKLTKRFQPLEGRSSLYCEDMWRRYCCLTSFFSDCRYVP